MKRATLIFALLAGCGGGATYTAPVPPSVPVPVDSDYRMTPNHRFGLANGGTASIVNLIWIQAYDPFDLVSPPIAYLTPTFFSGGSVWETDLDLPDGLYRVNYLLPPFPYQKVTFDFKSGVRDALVLR